MKTAEFFNKLKSENLSQLEKDSHVSRQALHSASKSRNMKLDNLSSVAKALNFQIVLTPRLTEENLMSSLALLGAPLAHSKNGTLSLYESVSEALKRSREDGVYESLVPYVLWKNVDQLNPLKLVAKAYSTNQVNVLGYFIEMAHAFRPHEKFSFILKLLEPAKSLTEEFLVSSTKTHFPELFLKNKLAIKWNLKVRGSVDDHLQRWEKWAQSPSSN
jgi:hypothetical protein